MWLRSLLVAAPKTVATAAVTGCPPAAKATDGSATNVSTMAAKMKVRNEAKSVFVSTLKIEGKGVR